MMKSNILKELLEKGSQAEKQFIADLSDAERNQEGTNKMWTAKDNIAHNAHWRKHHAENMLAALGGEKPTRTEDINHTNEAIYYQYRDQTWEEVEALARSSCERMEEALNAVGDEGLERVDFYPWQEGHPLWRFVIGNIYTHPILHLADWYGKNGENARVVEMYQDMSGLLADLDDSPDWQGSIHYNLACSYSLAKQREKAIYELGKALKLNPSLTEWSRQDPDFDPIRGELGYQELYK
jgi:tetratricopeptide (TPR) repeat protein